MEIKNYVKRVISLTVFLSNFSQPEAGLFPDFSRIHVHPCVTSFIFFKYLSTISAGL